MQLVILSYLTHQMTNYAAMCNFSNVSEQPEQNYSLLYCDEWMHYIDFEQFNEILIYRGDDGWVLNG